MNVWFQSPATEIDAFTAERQSFADNARHNRGSTHKYRYFCNLRGQIIRLGEKLLDRLHYHLEDVSARINKIEVISLGDLN